MIPPHVPTLPFTTGVADLGERVFHGSSGARVPLTDVEVRLLGYLAGRGVVGRDQLLREVWGWSARAVSRTVDTAVWRLRQKVEADPSSPEHLLTAPGGWRLQLLAPAPEAPVGVVRREGAGARTRGAVGDVGGLSGGGGVGPAVRLVGVGSQRSAVSGQQSAVSGQRSAVSGQQSAVSKVRADFGSIPGGWSCWLRVRSSA